MRKKHAILVLAGIIIGVLGLATVRFFTLKSDEVHYHADFALYINEQRDEFNNFTFYEEVQACEEHDANNVKARVHLHDKKSSLIHVHDNGVTWGQFFANLGYTLGDKAVVTDGGVYVNGISGNKLSFLLNGEPVQTLENRVIRTEDVVLINYGNEEAKTLQNRYDAIPRTARKANTEKDPSTCSGNSGLTLTDRLKQSLGINP